jgi:hypothetical protein
VCLRTILPLYRSDEYKKDMDLANLVVSC